MQLIKLFFLMLISAISLFAANNPIVSISPLTQEVVEGTLTTTVTISVDECPNVSPIEVTYVNEANTSNTGVVTFLKSSCDLSQSVTINIPTSLIGSNSFFVTISAASAQTFTPPSPNSAEIVIIAPPSNTPTVSISPVTKNIAIGTATVDMFALITECPNSADINVTYVNDGNSSDTGSLIFYEDSCVSPQTFTVNVPAGLVVGDSFDVNISATTLATQNIGSVYPDHATITILETVSDLNITKSASAAAVSVNDVFTYTVDVVNGGPSTATGIEVQDELPAGLTIDLVQTNLDSPDWVCTQVAPVLTCTHDSNISNGDTSTITITATAPSSGGLITNRASVYSDNDSDILNNSAQVTTMILDTSYATDICYTNSIAEEDHPNTCSALTGISYYEESRSSSYTCTATMTLKNANTVTTLENVVVTKMYSPDINNGTCTTTSGSCSRVSPINITDYSGYLGGYVFDLGTVNPDANITITDSDTYHSTLDVNDTMLYATYTKGGFTYAGKVSACTGGASNLNVSEYAAQVDVNDDYNTSSGTYVPWIKTKVSGKDGYVMKAVYLGAYGETPEPQPYTPDVPNQSSSITVLYKLVDMDALDEAAGETCESATPVPLMTVPGGSEPVYSVINENDMSVESPPFIMAYTPDGSTPEARKNLKFQYKTVDFNQLIDDAGINCVQRSSTGGVVEGIPACMISNPNDTNDNQNTAIENYIAVFGVEAYESCYTDNGEPCYASNGGVGAYPYDTELGCFECSIGAFPAVCSQDSFAIRPETFVVDSTENSFPDLMRAGQDYDVTVNAVNYGTTTNSIGYNQVRSNLYVADPIKYWGEGGEANASMFGQATWGADFNITDGYTSIGGVASAVPYSYDEVGDIAMRVVDYTWAAVDINNLNDPTPHDCSDDGAYLCGDTNATFIPHHFAVTIDDLHNNSDADSFTYLSNDLNMSARFGVTIIAQNEQNSTTKNFTQPKFGHTFYENPMTIVIDAPDSLELGAAVTDDINTSQLLGFDAGSKSIPWSEDNETLRLAFNYPRTTNTPVNPFIVGGQSNVDANSTYTGTAPEGTAYIDGTDDADDNVTFVYGRTHMARTRAMCNGGGNCLGNMTFFFEFYGDQDANRTLITNLLGTPPPRSLDSVNWYRNTEHNTSSDGNVTGSTTNIPGTIAYTPNGGTTSSAVYNYTGSKGYPYKGTVTVPQSTTAGTQSWLIYDKYKPDPAIEVRGELEYYGPGQWSSDTGAAESVEDASGKKNRNTNRRIRW